MSNKWDTSQYNRNPSISYRTAVKALQALLGSEDENAVERAFAEVISQQRYQAYSQQNGKERKDEITPASPLSSGTFGTSDHKNLWIKNGEVHKYTAQPYELSWESLRSLVKRCEETNLEASISARKSWHFPSWTFLLEVFKTTDTTQTHSESVRGTDTTHIPMTNSQSYDTGKRKGYHQGWKDALDIMGTMINRYDLPYSRAENGCLEYWRSPLLQWMRGDTSSEVPPELHISSILSSDTEEEDEEE